MRQIGVFFILVLAALPAHAGKVKEVISPAGFKAWLVEEPSQPLVSIRITFKNSGSAYDPKDKQGRASLTSALLMEGAGDMNQREFSDALEAKAIQLGSSVDEDTIDIALDSLSEHIDSAFGYAALAITKPRFDDSAVERIKKQRHVILTQQEQQPGYKLAKAWRKAAFGDHPYGYEPMGTQDSIDDISTSDMRRVVERYLTRENIVIAAAGDITPQQLAALMDKHLAALPARYDADSKVEEITLAQGEQPVVIDFDIPQTIVFFGAAGVKRNDPNYFAAYVMNHILGGAGSLNSLLGEQIRVQRGLAYSVATQLEPLTYSASWRGSFSSRNDQARTAVNVLLASLQAFVEKGPTDEELEDAKQFLINSFVLNLDSNSDLAHFLINMQLHNLGIDYLERRNSMVASVQKDAVVEMARRLIVPDKMLLMMIGKPVLKNPAPAS